jgi:glycosyltransferase involved in cell wall biosynthesis
MPLISIITPNYNGAAFIAETIASARAQTLTDWEMIIVDDASDDASQEIIRREASSDSRLRLIVLPERSGGPAKPRNVGLNAAQGEYVIFLDNDDLWHPQKLELQLAAMRRTGARISSSAILRFRRMEDIPPEARRTFNESDLRARRLTYEMTLRRHCAPHLMAERRLFVENGVRFDERPEYNKVEDTLLSFELHRVVGWSVKISPPLTFYRQHPDSLSASKIPIIRKQRFLYAGQLWRGRPIVGWRFGVFFFHYAVRTALSRLSIRINAPFLRRPFWNCVDY